MTTIKGLAAQSRQKFEAHLDELGCDESDVDFLKPPHQLSAFVLKEIESQKPSVLQAAQNLAFEKDDVKLSTEEFMVLTACAQTNRIKKSKKATKFLLKALDQFKDDEATFAETYFICLALGHLVDADRADSTALTAKIQSLTNPATASLRDQAVGWLLVGCFSNWDRPWLKPFPPLILQALKPTLNESKGLFTIAALNCFATCLLVLPETEKKAAELAPLLLARLIDISKPDYAWFDVSRPEGLLRAGIIRDCAMALHENPNIDSLNIISFICDSVKEWAVTAPCIVLGFCTVKDLAEAVPLKISRNPEILTKLFQTSVHLLITLPLIPLEDQGELTADERADHPYEASMSAAEELMDLLAENYSSHLSSRIYSTVFELAAQPDIKSQVAARRILTASTEYTTEECLQQIEFIVKKVLLPGLIHVNANIQFATITALGQMATDLGEDFCDTYGMNDLLKVLLNLLESADEDFVKRHAAAALLNLIEETSHEAFEPFVDYTVQRVNTVLRSASTVLMQEAIIPVLSSIAATGKESLMSVAPALAAPLLSIAKIHDPAYENLRMRAHEALSFLATSCLHASEEGQKLLEHAYTILLQDPYIAEIRQGVVRSRDNAEYLVSALHRLLMAKCHYNDQVDASDALELFFALWNQKEFQIVPPDEIDENDEQFEGDEWETQYFSGYCIRVNNALYELKETATDLYRLGFDSPPMQESLLSRYDEVLDAMFELYHSPSGGSTHCLEVAALVVAKLVKTDDLMRAPGAVSKLWQFLLQPLQEMDDRVDDTRMLGLAHCVEVIAATGENRDIFHNVFPSDHTKFEAVYQLTRAACILTEACGVSKTMLEKRLEQLQSIGENDADQDGEIVMEQGEGDEEDDDDDWEDEEDDEFDEEDEDEEGEEGGQTATEIKEAIQDFEVGVYSASNALDILVSNFTQIYSSEPFSLVLIEFIRHNMTTYGVRHFVFNVLCELVSHQSSLVALLFSSNPSPLVGMQAAILDDIHEEAGERQSAIYLLNAMAQTRLAQYRNPCSTLIDAVKSLVEKRGEMTEEECESASEFRMSMFDNATSALWEMSLFLEKPLEYFIELVCSRAPLLSDIEESARVCVAMSQYVSVAGNQVNLKANNGKYACMLCHVLIQYHGKSHIFAGSPWENCIEPALEALKLMSQWPECLDNLDALDRNDLMVTINS